MFLGPVAIWISAGIFSFLFAWKKGLIPQVIFADRLLFYLVLAWVGLLAAAFLMDLTTLANRNIMAGPLLNLLSLITFLGIVGCMQMVTSANIIRLLMAIAAIQGIIAVCQFLGFAFARELPETIMNATSSFSRTSLRDDEVIEHVQNVGRSRGTQVMIHVFTGVHATITALCIFLAFHPERKLPWQDKTFRFAAILCATAGLLVTFSRSGVLACLLAVLVALTLKPRLSRWGGVAVASLILLSTFTLMGFFEDESFLRISNFDRGANTNADRFDHLRITLSNFYHSPLFGESATYLTIVRDVPIHSVLLRYLNDYGLLGAIPYVLCLALLVAIFIRSRRSRNQYEQTWGGAGLAVVAALLADSWTHSSGFLRRDVIQSVLLAVTVGMALRERWTSGDQIPDPEPEHTKESPPHRFS
jgi:hypothetical protein